MKRAGWFGCGFAVGVFLMVFYAVKREASSRDPFDNFEQWGGGSR